MAPKGGPKGGPKLIEAFITIILKGKKPSWYIALSVLFTITSFVKFCFTGYGTRHNYLNR
jgi:hypothetical protein